MDVEGVGEVQRYHGAVAGLGDPLDGGVENLGQFLPDLFDEALADFDAVPSLLDEEARGGTGQLPELAG